MEKIKIGLVGLGNVARDQHIPALRASEAFDLPPSPARQAKLDGLRLQGLAGADQGNAGRFGSRRLSPPQARFEIARAALARGLHVLLERPPGVAVSEVVALEKLAHNRGVTLFASWHSRHARGVEPARDWLRDRRIRRINVTWKEDVRVWHPGQTWIWKSGGLGVFDPGINALSILTRIVPHVLVLTGAELSFPRNCATPIAASLSLAGEDYTVLVNSTFFRPAHKRGPSTLKLTPAGSSSRWAAGTSPSTVIPCKCRRLASIRACTKDSQR